MPLLDKVALGFSGIWLFVAVIAYSVCAVRKIGNGSAFRDFWLAWNSVPAIPVIVIVLLHTHFYLAHAGLLMGLYFLWAAVVFWLCRTTLWEILGTIR